MLGDDVLYVNKWPWFGVSDWWNYVNRPAISSGNAVALNRLIAATPNSLLLVAVPEAGRGTAVKAGANQVGGVYLAGTTADFRDRVLTSDFEGGPVVHPGRVRRGLAGLHFLWLRCRRGPLPGPLGPRPEGDARRRAPVSRHRGPRAPGRVPRPVQHGQLRLDPAPRLQEILRHRRARDVAAGQGAGQDPPGRGDRRTHRRDAPMVRAPSWRGKRTIFPSTSSRRSRRSSIRSSGGSAWSASSSPGSRSLSARSAS